MQQEHQYVHATAEAEEEHEDKSDDEEHFDGDEITLKTSKASTDKELDWFLLTKYSTYFSSRTSISKRCCNK